MSVRAYIGLGANLGDPAAQVRWAIGELARLGPVRASSLYRTEPLGDPAQPWYVNAVVELETRLDAPGLLRRLKALERIAGREPGAPRWSPRRLDLDLLLHGSAVLDGPGLALPHPGLAERRFVLEPLAELAPDAINPRNGKTIRDLCAAVRDPLRVEKLPGYTSAKRAAEVARCPRDRAAREGSP